MTKSKLPRKNKKVSLIGRCFSITENGNRLVGMITKKIGKKYLVKWSDGNKTIEDVEFL